LAISELFKCGQDPSTIPPLETEKDPTKRAMLERLLAEEKAKQGKPR
jgi:hypothetical protein